jgi:ubiquinone/menaquinone biosynthesis C-methylase UbiE
MDALQNLVETESGQLARWEQRVEAMIRTKGGNVSAREFQRAVNVLFHDVEAAHYDKLHREMWESLQPIFDRIATDIHRISSQGTAWNLADVGCGTGLATALLLNTSLASRISSLQMVDTSEEMLSRCRARSSAWGLPAEFVRDQIDALPDASADILVTCSVLHHIPEIISFCRQVRRVVKPGGFYIHVHDQRQGAMDSSDVVERSARLTEIRNQQRSRVAFLPFRIIRSALARVRRRFKTNYLDEVNGRLIAAGFIKTPLTPGEIWSITDLHVGDLPYSASDGVGVDELAVALTDFDCVSLRTYGFFGVLASNLPAELASEERQLIDRSSPDGVFLAGTWMRRR